MDGRSSLRGLGQSRFVCGTSSRRHGKSPRSIDGQLSGATEQRAREARTGSATRGSANSRASSRHATAGGCFETRARRARTDSASAERARFDDRKSLPRVARPRRERARAPAEHERHLHAAALALS